MLLENKEAIATVAVKNLEPARKFYEEKLGLKPTEGQEEGVVTYKNGHTSLFVYQSQYAGTNKATTVTWVVGKDIDNIVRTLKGRGVTFEHYDFPDTKLEGDVHVTGHMKAAWLKDPDGNIHALVSA